MAGKAIDYIDGYGCSVNGKQINNKFVYSFSEHILEGLG